MTKDVSFINQMLLETIRSKDPRIPLMFLHAISQPNSSVNFQSYRSEIGEGWEIQLLLPWPPGAPNLRKNLTPLPIYGWSRLVPIVANRVRLLK